MKDNKNLLSVAVEAAKEAAITLLSDAEHMRRVRKDLYRDVKIEADFASENCIQEILSQETKYPLLSEEGEETNDAAGITGRYWIVDPLDGSFNFSRGIPLCCISIALWENMEPLLGVVYDFNRNELFTGIVGVGAWLNNAQIRVSEIDEISRAVLCTGFPVGFNLTKINLDGFYESIKEFKKVRLIGSAALSLSYVACGRADFYHEKDIKIWDVAGGLALVKAAGGRIAIGQSTKINSLNVNASNDFLFDK